MANVSRKSRGRAWELRQRSMQLWPSWIEKLSTQENPLSISTPLIQLARSKEEANAMKELAIERNILGIEFLPPRSTNWLQDWLPTPYLGGLISHNDGRINPLSLQKCLYSALLKRNVKIINQSVISLKRCSSNIDKQWVLKLQDGKTISQDYIVICAAMGSNLLLNPLGHDCAIEPVLGQAIKVQLNIYNNDFSKWPAVLINQGINMIPDGDKQMIIGATLEPGTKPNIDSLTKMKGLNGEQPEWLKRSTIIDQWYGIRCRPIQQPAPVHEQLEQGLILASGHYRNGILLAPVSAEWVGNQIK